MADETTVETPVETPATETPAERGNLAEILSQTFDQLEPTGDTPDTETPDEKPEPKADTLADVAAETDKPVEVATVEDVPQGELNEQQLFDTWESERAKVDSQVVQKYQPQYQALSQRIETLETNYAALKAKAFEVIKEEDPETGEIKEIKKPRAFYPDELDTRDQLVAAYNQAVAQRAQIVSDADAAITQARVPGWCNLVVRHDKRFEPYLKQLNELVAKGQHQRPDGDTLDKEDLLDLCAARWRRENPDKNAPPTATPAAAVIDAANATRAAESTRKKGLGAIAAGTGGASPVTTGNSASTKRDYAKDAPADVRESLNELKEELESRRSSSMRRKVTA